MPQVQIGKQTFNIPTEDSPCSMWQVYFDQLRKEVGADNAKVLWLMTWERNGDIGCTMDAGFNKWLREKGIDVSNTATRAIADTMQIGSDFLGLGKNITKVLSIGLPLALGGILLAIMVVLYNTARKADITDLAIALPQGRSAKALTAMKTIE